MPRQYRIKRLVSAAVWKEGFELYLFHVTGCVSALAYFWQCKRRWYWLRERDIPCGVILNNALPQVGTERECRWWRPSVLLVAAIKMGHSYRAQSDAYYLIHRAVNMQVVFMLIRSSLIWCTNKYIMISVRSLDMITILMYYKCTNNNRLFKEINNWMQLLSKQNVSSAWISLPQC